MPGDAGLSPLTSALTVMAFRLFGCVPASKRSHASIRLCGRGNWRHRHIRGCGSCHTTYPSRWRWP